MGIKTVTVIAAALLASSAAWAAPGSIVSSFSTGESSVWGVDVRQIGGVTEIHALAGGYVFRFDTSGEAKTQMTTESNGDLRGLVISNTWEGAYGTEYLASHANVSVKRSIWGVNGEPGALGWGEIRGAWSMSTGGDICNVSSSNAHSGIWTVDGTTIKRYTYPDWGGSVTASGNFSAIMDAGTSLTGVALGENNDLWLLANNGKIMNVSVTNMDGGATFSVIEAFNIDAAITNPWGIGYDAAHDTLWISDQADNKIYQVDTVPEVTTLGLLAGSGMVLMNRRRK